MGLPARRAGLARERARLPPRARPARAISGSLHVESALGIGVTVRGSAPATTIPAALVGTGE